MFDLIGVSESVVAAVVGAALVGIGSLLFSFYKQRNPVEWLEVAHGYTINGEDTYESSVSYCHVLLRNKSRAVVEDISVLVDHEVTSVDVPKGTQASIETEGNDSRIRIDALQPKSALLVKFYKEKSRYIHTRKVFVGKQDAGSEVFFKYVKHDAIIVPFWMLMLVLIWAVNIGVRELMDSQAEQDDSTTTGEISPTEGIPSE